MIGLSMLFVSIITWNDVLTNQSFMVMFIELLAFVALGLWVKPWTWEDDPTSETTGTKEISSEERA